MGKRKKGRGKKQEEQFDQDDVIGDFEYVIRNQDVKSRSKLTRKRNKRFLKLEHEKQHIKRHKQAEISRCGFHMVSAFVKDDIKLEKQFLLSSIRNYVDKPFCALGYFRNDDSFSFYFDANKDIAESIQSLDKKLQCPSGELIALKVKFVNNTDFILNCDQVEILKNVVLERFNPSNGLLDLSSLHLDPRLLESNTFAPLSNKRILKQVYYFIKDLMPRVHAFDLSNNKLHDQCLELLETLDLQSHSLTAVNLENNDLKNVKCLEHLRFFPLNELKVIGNCFKVENPSRNTLTTAVMKAVPFLKILDGVDVEARSNGSKKKYSKKNASSNSLQLNPLSNVTEENMKTFLEQYYSLLDTGNRGALLQAYVPSAKIEIKSENPFVPSKIFEGQIDVQEFLNSWPETKYDHSSFRTGFMTPSPDQGLCEVQGTCLIVESQLALQFKRVMRIIPFNTGFCCDSDTIFFP